MRRDTFLFSLAGIVFGFVVGYMAANWGVVPRPAGAAAATGSPTEAAAPAALDPNEVKALESLAGRDPQDFAVRVELGNLYMDHDRWEDAIRWYREALALNPDLPDVRTDLGASLVNAGRPEEGLSRFDEVLAQDATHRNALFNKGIALMQMGRAPEAVAAWEEVLRLHPNDPQLQGLRAQIDAIRSASGGDGQ